MKDFPVTDVEGRLLGRLTLADTFIDTLERNFPHGGFSVSVEWARSLEDINPKIVGFAFVDSPKTKRD